jgi:hypothetical protein
MLVSKKAIDEWQRNAATAYSQRPHPADIDIAPEQIPIAIIPESQLPLSGELVPAGPPRYESAWKPNHMKPCDERYAALYTADSPALCKDVDDLPMPACCNCGSGNTHIFEVAPSRNRYTHFGYRRLVCLDCLHEVRVCGILIKPKKAVKGTGGGAGGLDEIEWDDDSGWEAECDDESEGEGESECEGECESGSSQPSTATHPLPDRSKRFRVCLSKPSNASIARCRRHDRKWLRVFGDFDFTGSYGQLLPERLQAAYDAVVSEPDLLNSRHELALLKTFLISKIEELQQAAAAGETTGASSAGWAMLRKLWGKLEAATKAGDAEKSKGLLVAVGTFIKNADRKEEICEEIRQLAKEKTAMARMEQDTLESQQRVCTQEQVLQLVTALGKAVHDVVTEEQGRVIDAKFQRILGNGGDEGVV